MTRFVVLALLLLQSCAALTAGWTRVTWDGQPAKTNICTHRYVGPESDSTMHCKPLPENEADLWKPEQPKPKENFL